jgi:hypothetical protein
MTADHANVNLDRATIRQLLSEHREQTTGDELIVSRPGGGWIVITASHVLPTGTIDQCASTDDCLTMYCNTKEQT